MAKRGKVIRFPGSPAVPAGPAPPAPAHERGLVEIRRCAGAEAMVLKSLLESEGIPTLLRSRLVHSLHPFSVGDQGEVVVMVPESEATRSRLLLARVAPGPGLP